MSVVIDASATLALLFNERGGDVVKRAIRGSLISAVNLDEVLHKGARKTLSFVSTLALLNRLEVTVIPFDLRQAEIAAALHPKFHGLDISFGDRACFALATVSSRPVLTTDRDWSVLDLDVQIIQIR